jgi:hypothetical protein
MMSLRKAISTIGSDLPDGFEAASGVRSLFPAGQNAAVSQLQGYRFKHPLALTTSLLACTGTVKATGSGTWVLSGTVTADGTELIPVHYDVGFAFKSPVDGFVRSGFANGEIPIHTGTISRDFYASGRDDWIVEHWPTAFAAGIVTNMVAGQDVAELIRELQIVVGVGVLVLVSGGSVAVAF